MRKLTLQQLVESEKSCFTPEDVCWVLGTNPHTIRLMARERPDLLGFDCFIIRSRIKIPKIPFLRKMGIDLENQNVLKGEYENEQQ